MYELRIADSWRIFYKYNTVLKMEILKKAFPMQPQTGTLSGFRLREAPALINERGVFLTPTRVFYDGIWGYERLANMLPEDYEAK
jgi:hypothetical protein